MSKRSRPDAAIVDYGLGNLYSVLRACERVGLTAEITSSAAELLSARSVILPGVGAFGDAMANLRVRDLVGPLREAAQRGTPVFGICLGLQLLMSESEEFGLHQGLNIIRGRVVHLGRPHGGPGPLKVPQVGWNRIRRPNVKAAGGDPWSGTPLSGTDDGAYQYFVHSFYVTPEDPGVVLARTRYGDVEFCSAVRQGNVFAFQFHPERSGAEGTAIYRNIAEIVRSHSQEKENCHAA
ncbi:MAG: imidazole glycerol phosphate synthase subunit HisH [Planctomycetes bacterium]|nr:imidazole glycerol phosphate synthase subunit HisH [Planctomycetota bacterium]